MNRLVIRYEGGACMSTDMVGQAWEPALAELLPRHQARKNPLPVNTVEMAVYDGDYLHRFRFWKIDVDLATWVYTPPDPATPALEGAPTPTPEPVLVTKKRSRRKPSASKTSSALPVRPSRREKKAA